MGQIPTYQHLAPATATTTMAGRPSVQLIETNEMDMDTGMEEADARPATPSPQEPPQQQPEQQEPKAETIMGSIFAQAHGVKLDHQAAQAAGKGYEQLKGISQSTAQALPFSSGMKGAFGGDHGFQDGAKFFDAPQQTVPPLRRSHSGGEIESQSASGSAPSRRHSTYVSSGHGDSSSGRRMSLTGKTRIAKGNSENVRSKGNASTDGVLGKKRHFANMNDTGVDSTLVCV